MKCTVRADTKKEALLSGAAQGLTFYFFVIPQKPNKTTWNYSGL
jgi:hypothetical protein